jgi:hypothetical protein
MPTGVLGRQDLASGTPTILYTVPVDTFAVITVNITNRNAANISIRVAISDSNSPAPADYLEFDTELVANGTLERGGIVVDAGKNIVINTDTAGVSCIAYGIETPTS